MSNINFSKLGIAPRKEVNARMFGSAAFSELLRKMWKTSPRKAENLSIKFYKGDNAQAYMRMYWALRAHDKAAATQYAVRAVEHGSKEVEAIKLYVVEQYRKGSFKEANKYSKLVRRTKRIASLVSNVKSNTKLLNEGFSMPNYTSRRAYEPVPFRTFYLLHNSLPINSGGYATRAHGLLQGIHEGGFQAIGVTRYGFPHDRGAKYADGKYAEIDRIDGVDYLRLLSETEGLGRIPMETYLNKNIAHHGQLLRKYRPSIVHAASNFINGVTANVAAKKHGVMSIYEVRGLWEITRMSREPEYEGTDAFKLYVRMETEACNNANHCFAITQALKDEMISRGVDERKITLVPNGVDTTRFVPIESNVELKRSLGFSEDDVIVGYIGSIVDYEGLDYLIQAFAKIKAENIKNIKAVIVGDGAVLQNLQKLTEELGLSDIIIFTGRIPHHDVEKMYSIVDIAPFPRKAYPVCEMVSPLKPFEAMSMGKPIIVSNVSAMEEFVTHGENGLVFEKGNVLALYENIKQLAEDTRLRTNLGVKARRFVVQERDWKVLASTMTNVYQELIDKRKFELTKDASLLDFSNFPD